jgi:hypothetical protein
MNVPCAPFDSEKLPFLRNTRKGQFKKLIKATVVFFTILRQLIN